MVERTINNNPERVFELFRSEHLDERKGKTRTITKAIVGNRWRENGQEFILSQIPRQDHGYNKPQYFWGSSAIDGGSPYRRVYLKALDGNVYCINNGKLKSGNNRSEINIGQNNFPAQKLVIGEAMMGINNQLTQQITEIVAFTTSIYMCSTRVAFNRWKQNWQGNPPLRISSVRIVAEFEEKWSQRTLSGKV